MFGIGSKGDQAKFDQTTTPAPNGLKRVLGGLLGRGAKAAFAQVKVTEQKQHKAESKPLRNAFEAGNQNSDTTLRSLRSGSEQMREGHLLRKLHKNLAQIEAEIAKERDRPSPDQGRLNGLKELWAQDNDKAFAMMKGIRDRESKGLGVRSELTSLPQVRSLSAFNEAKGLSGVKQVDLNANAELKKMSELREKVELSLASATDGLQKRDLEELKSDIDKKVNELTRRALGG